MEHLAKLSNEVVHFSLGLLQLAQFLVCGLGQWPQVLVMVLDHSLKVTVEFQKCTCGYDLSLVVSIDRSLGLSESGSVSSRRPGSTRGESEIYMRVFDMLHSKHACDENKVCLQGGKARLSCSTVNMHACLFYMFIISACCVFLLVYQHTAPFPNSKSKFDMHSLVF